MHGMQHKRRPRPILHQRNPALITVPWDVQHIPLLGPLLKPLVAGPATSTSKTTTLTPTTTERTTKSSSISTVASANPPLEPITTTRPTSTPTITGNGNSNHESGDSHDSGSRGGNSSNSSSSNSSSSAAPASIATGPPSAIAAPGSGPANPVTSSSSQNPTRTAASSITPSSNVSVSVPVPVPVPVVNVAGDPLTEVDSTSLPSVGFVPNDQAFVTSESSDPQETPSSTRESGTDTVALTGTGQPTKGTGVGSVGDGNATSNGNRSSPTGTPDAASTHHGLPMSVVVAICVIVLLLSLLLLLCCVRRRAVVTRLRRRKQWFAGAAGDTQHNAKDDSAGTRSARSSFATSFDRGQLFFNTIPDVDFEVSSSMSQVWPSDLSGSGRIIVPLASHSVSSTPSPTVRNTSDRSSVHSTSSGGGSRPASLSSEHMIAVPQTAASKEYPVSPFFVRPFSSSETWSFPQPPATSDAESRAAPMIRRGSVQTSPFYSAEELQFATAEAENPFADITEVRPRTASTDNSAAAHFAPIEVIRRQFMPTMDDEMAVVPGELVRILRRFDDGWAVAEKIGVGPQGLVPIDCLRAPEEDLPGFLAKKRISSYRVGVSVVTRASVVSGGSSVGAAL